MSNHFTFEEYLSISLCILILSINLSLCERSEDVDHEKALFDHIFPKLPKNAAPIGYKTEVIVDPMVLHVLEVNERDGFWIAGVYMPLSFKIPNATWNWTDYGDINVLQVNKELIWTPVVVLDTTIDIEWKGSTDIVSIGYDGWVYVQSALAVAKTACSFDVVNFPFDEHLCSFNLEPSPMWGLYYLKENNNSRFSERIYRPNDQWDIVNFDEILRREGRKNNMKMVYNVHFRRKPLYYLTTIVFPITVIYLLSGLAFFLPSDDGEKLSFGVTILLAQIVAVSAMSDIFPASSTNVPYLLYFVSGVTLHMAIMCFESVLVLGLSQNGWRKWMGPKLRKFIASRFVNFIGLKPFTAKPTSKYLAFGAKRQSENKKFDGLEADPYEDEFRGNSELLQQKRENNFLRWRFLAMVVDRILLIIHMVVVVANLAFFAYKICS